MRFKTTVICQTCGKTRNVCQTCLLDFEYHLSTQVCDTALGVSNDAPLSDINREYYAQKQETRRAQGAGCHGCTCIRVRSVVQYGQVAQAPAARSREQLRSALLHPARYCALARSQPASTNATAFPHQLRRPAHTACPSRSRACTTSSTPCWAVQVHLSSVAVSCGGQLALRLVSTVRGSCAPTSAKPRTTAIHSDIQRVLCAPM
ncbi:hypothetical protein BJV74DRAFT_541947 [Russula compacta]|nr:hypothetical protein BJV74DRAFT_541947 [Russula compacta]